MPNRNVVLVVDDDPGMLRGVQRLLRQHDYEPTYFHLQRLSRTTPILEVRFASFSTST
jgi:FixJ family two-component response regulator